jgi:hypothetical protein
MEGTYRKRVEDEPPPSYDDLYKSSNEGIDNVGVGFAPEERNGKAEPTTASNDGAHESGEK